MNWDTITGLLPAVGGLLTVLFSLRREGSARGRLAKDVEVLGKLPEGPARQKMLDFIERQVTELALRRKREVPLAAFAALVVAGCTWATLELVQSGRWWAYLAAVPVVFLGLVCFYGLADSLTPKTVQESPPDSVDLTDDQATRQGSQP